MNVKLIYVSIALTVFGLGLIVYAKNLEHKAYCEDLTSRQSKLRQQIAKAHLAECDQEEAPGCMGAVMSEFYRIGSYDEQVRRSEGCAE